MIVKKTPIKTVIKKKPKRSLLKKRVKTDPQFTPDDQIDFPISQLKCFCLLNKTKIPISKTAIYRTDTNKVLGIVGEDYRPLLFRETLSMLESHLPVSIASRTIHVAYQGSRMFARYKSPHIKPAEPRKGDIVQFRIEIFNSYDGCIPLGMRLYALRLQCMNGMTIPGSISTINVRHRRHADLVNARKLFEQKVNQFDKTKLTWRRWANQKIDPVKFEHFLAKKVTYKTARAHILTKFRVEKDDTIWGAFNALTWWGTHVLRSQNMDPQNVKNVVSISEIRQDAPMLQFNFDKKTVEHFYKQNW